MPEGNNFYMKPGDTAPAIEARLEDANGAVDLSGINGVVFKMSEEGAGNPFYTGAAAVKYPSEQADPAKKGVVRYEFPADASQTSKEGEYRVEWTVEWSDGRRTTFPRGVLPNKLPIYNYVIIQKGVV